MGFYGVFFGLSVIAIEYRSTWFVDNFPVFQNSWVARGIFYIFVGILCPITVPDAQQLDSLPGGEHFYETLFTLMAVVMVFVGFMYFLMSLLCLRTHAAGL